MANLTRFLTAPQAAELLEVSDQTIRDWERAGRLRAAHTLPNGRKRFRRDDIEAILRGDAPASAA